MIQQYYEAQCTICQKKFGDNAPKFYCEDELHEHLRKNKWTYNQLFQWLICPDCEKDVEILEPQIVYKGKQMGIAEFCSRDLNTF